MAKVLGENIESVFRDWQLNEKQREAVEHMGSPLLILAGAGSGKTRVLTYRIANLIRFHGVKPSEILAITFTNKAALEMRERVISLVGIAARDMTISTFHSACSRILRSEIERLGYSSRFLIYDEADSIRLITSCLSELGYDKRQFHPRGLRSYISFFKNEMIDPDIASLNAANPFEQVAAETYSLYQQRLKENDALDFDDLLLLVINLFEIYPDVLKKYQRRFKHILVDEYQDTNMPQYLLVKLLAQGHRNLCVVGDDDQGIYSWRGADIRNILEFEKDYPDARVIKLEQNYRSTSTILEAAGAVVRCNRSRKPKTLWTENPPGEKVKVCVVPDEHTEAFFIAEKIKRLVGDSNARYSDIAVFYRIHAQSRVIEEIMVMEGIPYKIFAGIRFYERAEIKDIIAYLKVTHNPKDSLSLKRIIYVPSRGIGRKTVSIVEEYSKRTGLSFFDALKDVDNIPALGQAAKNRIKDFVKLIEHFVDFSRENGVDELIEEIWDKTGYMAELEAEKTIEAESRILNLKELLNVVVDFRNQYGAATLEDFLERVALVNETDDYDEKGGYVSLMTLHNAKGLEFPHVFITGMEEGLFPHSRSMEDSSDIEEERRLCYVGMTRAKKGLYLIRSLTRSYRGVPFSSMPSRFLLEIPDNFIEEISWSSAEEKAFPLLDLREGDVVLHEMWGKGVVLEVKGEGDDGEVRVDFETVGVKELMLKYAPLRKLT